MLVAWLAVAACATAAPLRVSTFQALEAAASRHGDVEVFVAASPLRCDREIAIVGNVTDTGLRNGFAASGGGGAVACDGGVVAFEGPFARHANNVAGIAADEESGGGGFLMARRCDAYLLSGAFEGGRVESKHAVSGGGGGVLHLVGSRALILGGEYRRNSASLSGGVFFVAGREDWIAVLTVEGGVFEDNHAMWGGVGAVTLGGAVIVHGGRFANNSCQSSGGAFHSGVMGSLFLNGGVYLCRNQIFNPTSMFTGDGNTLFAGGAYGVGGGWCFFLETPLGVRDSIISRRTVPATAVLDGRRPSRSSAARGSSGARARTRPGPSTARPAAARRRSASPAPRRRRRGARGAAPRGGGLAPRQRRRHKREHAYELPLLVEPESIPDASLEKLVMVAIGLDDQLRCVLWSRGAAAATGLDEAPATLGDLPFQTDRDRASALRECARVVERRGEPRPFPLRLARGPYRDRVGLVVQCVRNGAGGHTVLGSEVDGGVREPL
ncbi:hypothetical protein SO694_00067199 [Aureococcus anophagefferens]|uniref:Right handed beta helix domain-containing protein n=1 Tax=Aureococcus anophagefferens TaxID=44056 RepID=A0ABR1FQE7_AURAN